MLVLRYRCDGRIASTVHDLASRAAKVSVPLGVETTTLSDRLASSPPIGAKDGAASVRIVAHGYHWFGVETAV